MSFGFKSLTAAVLTCALAVGMTTAPAAAQFGEAAGLTEIMHPEYLRRDLTIFVQGLDLDETQQVIIEALFDEYENDFHAGFAQMQQRFDDEEWRGEIQSAANDKQRVLQMAFQPLQDWARERKSIGEKFLANVRVVLSAAQLEQWPEFERMFTREKTMHLARLSGEQVNLFHVIRDMHLDAGIEAMIRPVMLQYSVQLDDSLRRRNAALSSESNNVLESIMMADESASVDEIDRQTQLRIAVRNVNDSFVVLIAQSLPAAVAADFESRAMEEAYPRIFRRGPVERMYELALTSEKLNASQRESLQALWMQYQGELESVNQRLLMGLQDYEPKMLRRRAEQYVARQDGGRLEPLPNPTRDGFQERAAINDRYVMSLMNTLPQEVFAELPGAEKFLKADR